MPDNSAKKILIIDDEPDVTDIVAYNLRAKGFVVETLHNPNAGIGIAHTFKPDLVILDVMMPDLNGIQLCRMLRADPTLKNIPVIFLTAKAEENDRVQGLEVGGDDYICKPFSVKELVLRVQALLRRAPKPHIATEPANQLRKTHSQNTAPLTAGFIVLDRERHSVKVRGQSVELTATEFKLLLLLMERRGRVQTREHLLMSVWNYDNEIETRTVDTHVRRLREKLGSEAQWIETIRGVGYRFSEHEHPPANEHASA